MYRFTLDKEEWILRFSPNVQIETAEKEAIATSIIQMSKDLPSFPHGDSFLIFNESLGVIVFNIEKIPSLILTVSNIIEKDKWYVQKKLSIKPFE